MFDAFGEIGWELQRWYVSFVHARIFGVPQHVMAQYLEFFAQHPKTLWSEVAGIGAFVANPYDIDLPRTIGYFFYGSPVGLNVGVWVQDGIAGAPMEGPQRPVIATLVCHGPGQHGYSPGTPPV